MKLKTFKEKIIDFVSENFEIIGLCSNCADNGEPYIVPYNYKGYSIRKDDKSFDRAIKKLYEELKERDLK